MPLADFQTQRSSVELLQRSLAHGRLGHAYLFSGFDLGELESIACALAQTVNCLLPEDRPENGLPQDACGECRSCRQIASGNHADVHWLRPESKSRIITIDQIRDLMHEVQMKPNSAAYKVCILSGADRLNPQSANAFLKTLEEPPAQSILILLTTEPGRILETIISRCLRLNLAGESGCRLTEQRAEWLKGFAGKAARGAEGLLDRYKLLGELLQQLKELKKGIEDDLSAKSPLEQYDELDVKLRDKWEGELAAGIEAEYRRQRADVLIAVEWWLRDVWLMCRDASEDLLSFPEFAPLNAIITRRISEREAARNLDVIEKTIQLLNTNVQEALALEVGLLKLNL